MSRHTQGSLSIVGAIGGGIFVVALVALMVLGDYSFSPALFLALLVALFATIVLYLGFAGPARQPSTPPQAVSKPAAAPAASAAPAPNAEPASAAAPAAPAPTPATSGAAAKPQGLSAPREGGADDLKKIKGVGPKLEKLLNSMGYYHFDQIAAWGASEVAWVDENLEGFKGRVSRDNWVDQAQTLASGGSTAFSKKVDGGDVY